MIIRPAHAREVSSIIALGRQSPGTPHWSEDEYLRAITLGSRRITLVAESDAPVIAAFLVAHKIGDEWELENIVVDEKARRRGNASAILLALIAEARRLVAKRIFLEVRASNAAAISLYRKAGFQQDGIRKSYYSNPPEDALLFSLSLENSS